MEEQKVEVDQQQQSKMSIKVDTGIEKFMFNYHELFRNALDRILIELKDKMHVDNLVHFVVVAMTVVKDIKNLHNWQRKDFVIDLIHKLVAALPVSDEEKQRVQQSFLPMLDSLIDVFSGANKGHLIFYEPPATKSKKKKEKHIFKLKLSKNVTLTAQRDDVVAATILTQLDEQLDTSVIVNEVYQLAKPMIQTKTFNLANLVGIGLLVMQLVDQYPQLTGAQKKQIVLLVVRNLLNETSLDALTKELLNRAIDTTLTAAIDVIIKAKNGEIEIVNQIIEKFNTCCATKK